VAVGRASIELKFLSTPPVPPEELPELVRFQALKQFTALGDDWPLDFVPLSPNADGGQNVLAAAISSELVDQIRQTCSAAGVNISRLVLRPFAAAALLQDELNDGKCRMIVDLLQDEADLTVLIGSQVIFPRTVRLPAVSEAEVLARSLLAEGRRTMIAAQNQLGGRRVEEVVIFGDGSHHSTLKQLLEKELSLSVRLVDPFEKVELSGEARAKKLEYPGTFAPLLGMLLDEAANRPPVIDFLHPRKKPTPPNKRRTYLLAGGAVAALLLAGVMGLQMQLWALDDQIGRLTLDLNNQKKTAITLAEPKKFADKLDAFAASDAAWLDELARLSQKLPPADKVRLDDFNGSISPKGGAEYKFNGVTDSSETKFRIENALADQQHRVRPGRSIKDTQLKGLQWKFDETVEVLPPAAAASPPAAAKATARPQRQGGQK
jgi:hypothetical protein